MTHRQQQFQANMYNASYKYNAVSFSNVPNQYPVARRASEI